MIDPSANELWNAGVDFALTELCSFLDVDPRAVNWVAATGTAYGDVSAVIGNILRAKFGDDYEFNTSKS
jgi:hypothetical protein